MRILQETKYKPLSNAIFVSGSKETEKKILIEVNKSIDMLDL